MVHRVCETAILYDDDYLLHETGNHPENSERLHLIMNHLKHSELLDDLEVIRPEKAAVQEVERAHTLDYIKNLKSSCSSGVTALDTDTHICQHSYEVALLAAGGGITAVDRVMSEEVEKVFCLVRPPGHHAERDRAMGFCLFNNISIAAYHAMHTYELERILIFDWDVHHGNGTQAMFYRDPRVLYCSAHQRYLFPGTGLIEENGAGEGENYTINVPLHSGCGDSDYELMLREVLEPICEQFRPQLVLISAGQDGHEEDFLAGMQLSTEGYGMMAETLKDIADCYCDGRTVLFLEGGYSTHGAPQSIVSILKAMSGCSVAAVENLRREEVKETTRETVGVLRSQSIWL